MKKAMDLKGQRFERLVVLERVQITKGRVHWLCQCDCGNQCVVRRDALRNNNTRSCGCLFIDVHTIHGKSKTKAYQVWDKMLRRCYNSEVFDYKNYGRRGIRVCKRWHKFENFLKDMGQPPEGLTIERIDNDKSYSKKNCKWATRYEQRHNMRRAKSYRYYVVTSPTGSKIYIDNLREFCREHNLDNGAMGVVAQNRRRAHKGWICEYQ